MYSIAEAVHLKEAAIRLIHKEHKEEGEEAAHDADFVFSKNSTLSRTFSVQLA